MSGQVLPSELAARPDRQRRMDGIYDKIFRVTRRRRMARFQDRMKVADGERILDVGGDLTNWVFLDAKPRLVLLNINIPSDAVDSERVKWVSGDALAMTYADGKFDMAFSNSVIEHLGTWEAQQRFASECRRVGRRLWIQTPAMCFPIEPHYLTPFVHWLPVPLRRRVGRWFTVWGWIARPSPQRVEKRVRSIRILTKREMEQLFPDCRIVVERFCLWPKSYIAVRS